MIVKEHLELGHLGSRKIYDYIINSYFIVDKRILKELIETIIKACILCVSAKNNNFRLNLGSHLLNDYKVGEIIALDYYEFSGIKSKTNFNSNYVLVILDVISAYITLYYTDKISSSFTIRSIMSYIGIHGRPSYIWTDNAQCFRSTSMVSFCKSEKMHLLTTSPQKSSTHGLIERKIYSIKLLVKILNEGDNLDKLMRFCPDAARILNSQPRSKSIEITPHLIQFLSKHRDLRITLDWVPIHAKDYDLDKLQFLQDKIDTELMAFRKNAIKTLEKQNAHRVSHKFRIGNLVLIKMFSLNKNKAKYSKIPYMILKVGRHVATCQNVLDKTVLHRNVMDIKKYNEYEFKNLPQEIKSVVQFFGPDYIYDLRNRAVQKPKVNKRVTRNTANIDMTEYDDSDSDEVTFVEI